MKFRKKIGVDIFDIILNGYTNIQYTKYYKLLGHLI